MKDEPEWFLDNPPVHVEIEGPFKREHDRWPCYTLSAKDRVVAAVFYVDDDSERARKEAELIRAALRLGGKAIERAHYAEASTFLE
jgi:hypothetical protein